MARHTQACLDGRCGEGRGLGLESSSPHDCPPCRPLSKESHGPFEASGYMVYQSDMKPVGSERRDWTRA